MIAEYFNSNNSKSLFDHIIHNIYGKYTLSNTLNKDENIIYLKIKKYDLNGLFGTNILATLQLIGSIDIKINNEDKIIDIIQYTINNKLFSKTHNNKYGKPIDDEEAELIMKILFEIIENIGKENSCKKIRLETHKSLKYYKNDKLNKFGFYLTGKKSEKNPCWVMTEKTL